MPDVRQVHPDLVRAPSEEPHFQQAEFGAPLAHPYLGAGADAALAHAHAPLAAGRYIFVQRVAKLERRLGRRAFDQGRIELFHLALPELAMQLGQGAALLAHDEQA